MKMTLTATGDKYIVHELLKPDDAITPCDPPEVMHSSEVAGRDIRSSEDGFWKEITSGTGVVGNVFMDAGPIEHRGTLNDKIQPPQVVTYSFRRSLLSLHCPRIRLSLP
jgi:hypothetical protein